MHPVIETVGNARNHAFSIRRHPPFLVAAFDAPQTMLSWSLTRPGFVVSRSVVWLEVRDGDLPLYVDPVELLRERMSQEGHAEAVHLMTSRDLAHHHLASAAAGDITSSCLATVGLSNAGRIGEPFDSSTPIGTINLLAHVDASLSEAAQLEALSIATEARTAAVMDLGLVRSGRIVTGTGTDCIVVAYPCEGTKMPFAGLHTDIGLSLGRAVYDAVTEGGLRWLAERSGV
ncbi:adenosylcobinamide amidohydrolase [Shinella sp. S4-D37]|uniref:adenosylcobinamide amidohydrolase n=1 Tax=Shinella sp. S4-D37 TaxID=3161999 RepID=UPI0034663D40